MRRLLFAMLAYAVLIGFAIYELTGLARYSVLVLLAGLALKTLIAHKAGWAPPAE